MENADLISRANVRGSVDKPPVIGYNVIKDYDMTQKHDKLEKKIKIQQTLEGYRRFDYDYIPFGTNWFVPDGEYRYRITGLRRISAFFLRFLMATVGAAAIKLVYGARVTGRRNLKALKKQGAVCVCNHISYLDTLFVRQAVGHFRSYHTMAPWNNKTGLGGWFIRRGGMLPFSPNLTATRNLNRELERLLKSGKIVNFYAEQAMWQNYQKPRPMKDGAFYYAEKFGVPVLPVLCTFRVNKRGHMKKLRINILPPVYADASLPRKARAAKMKEEAQRAWTECYERTYGIPLEYLPQRGKGAE